MSDSAVTQRPKVFADLLLARADDDHPGLLFEDSRWTWRQVVRESFARAAVLADLRQPGRELHVGVLLENEPEYIFLIGAAALSGATLIGINPTRRGAALAADIRATDCDLIITDAAQLPLLAGLDTGVDPDRIMIVGGAAWAARIVAARERAVPVSPSAQDPATRLLLTFTSGSTAAPKAVICSTGRLAALATANPFGITRDDVTYNAMPLFHGNAIMACWAPSVRTGATFTMRRKFSVSGFLPDIRRFGVTYFNYVGRSLAYLLSAPESPLESDTRLRLVFGTEAAPRDRAEFERRFGVRPVESYGSSEGAIVIRMSKDAPPNSLGRAPEFMNIEIHDEAGRRCPRARFDSNGRLCNAAEAIGEIVNTTGATLFEGYYNNAAATRERLSGTVFRSGDLGYRDEAGYFYFAGRSGDRIRVDSENFSAAPVERILARFPDAALVAVYPVPDARTGDQVMATVELVAGADFDAEAFGEFLSKQPDLGTKWAPRYLRIIEQMPVTATRKIDKPALRRAAWLVDDPIYLREPRSTHYRRADGPALAEIMAEFAHYGRAPR
ncbi:AMP-binding protein [Nocardia sp. NPDC051321]|uniref:AMP-binding protein n=1 Tax=Nocardia sp. NPDC051321 TaxID=3364323 RepID=UPI0037A03236